MSLFTELKRRNVFKVGAAYLVVGWVMIEVTSTVAPNLNLPEWAPRLITLMVLVGFPLALVLAWIFDMTPEGVQVTEGNTGNKRFYTIVAIIAAVALGWFFLNTPEESAVPVVVEVAAPVGVHARPSIAVLAFEDLSQEGDQAYFARGISEELLNILAGVGGLKVASRTSAFSFAGTSTPLPEIARQLDVAHVLEGSVRKQGNRVRITAQLIDAATDAHLWSANYDRDLTDIFAVQENIARAITSALEVVLGTRQVSVEAPTQNLEAYQGFLRGRTRFHQRVELDAATEDLRTAVTLDPAFAEAWTYLGAVAYVLRTGGYGTTQDLSVAEATYLESIEQALALNPDIPLALALHAQSFLNDPGAENFATGLEMLERVASRVTEDSTPRMWLGMQYLQLGYVEQALTTMRQAYEQDPLVPINNGYYGLALYMSGRKEEGILHVRRAAELTGGELHYWLTILVGDLVARGDLNRARALMGDFTGVGNDEAYIAVWQAAQAAVGDDAAERAVLDRIEIAAWNRQFQGMFAVLFADVDALAALAQTSHDEYSLEVSLAAWHPNMNVRERPEYFAMMEHWGIAAYWAANGYPRGCRLATSPMGDHLDCSARRVP